MNNLICSAPEKVILGYHKVSEKNLCSDATIWLYFLIFLIDLDIFYFK